MKHKKNSTHTRALLILCCCLLAYSTALHAIQIRGNFVCPGNGNHHLSVYIEGGCAPYTYAWQGPNGSSTAATIPNPTTGNYSVTVTDVNGCQATTSEFVDLNINTITCTSANAPVVSFYPPDMNSETCPGEGFQSMKVWPSSPTGYNIAEVEIVETNLSGGPMIAGTFYGNDDHIENGGLGIIWVFLGGNTLVDDWGLYQLEFTFTDGASPAQSISFAYTVDVLCDNPICPVECDIDGLNPPPPPECISGFNPTTIQPIVYCEGTLQCGQLHLDPMDATDCPFQFTLTENGIATTYNYENGNYTNVDNGITTTSIDICAPPDQVSLEYYGSDIPYTIEEIHMPDDVLTITGIQAPTYIGYSNGDAIIQLQGDDLDDVVIELDNTSNPIDDEYLPCDQNNCNNLVLSHLSAGDWLLTATYLGCTFTYPFTVPEATSHPPNNGGGNTGGSTSTGTNTGTTGSTNTTGGGGGTSTTPNDNGNGNGNGNGSGNGNGNGNGNGTNPPNYGCPKPNISVTPNVFTGNILLDIDLTVQQDNTIEGFGTISGNPRPHTYNPLLYQNYDPRYGNPLNTYLDIKEGTDVEIIAAHLSSKFTVPIYQGKLPLGPSKFNIQTTDWPRGHYTFTLRLPCYRREGGYQTATTKGIKVR